MLGLITYPIKRERAIAIDPATLSLSTSKHPWRVHAIISGLPQFHAAFTNAATAARTVMELRDPNDKKVPGFMQHHAFGIYDRFDCESIAKLPAQKWTEDGHYISEHPVYREWLVQQQECVKLGR